jgi:hypothetical protein
MPVGTVGEIIGIGDADLGYFLKVKSAWAILRERPSDFFSLTGMNVFVGAVCRVRRFLLPCAANVLSANGAGNPLKTKAGFAWLRSLVLPATERLVLDSGLRQLKAVEKEQGTVVY